MYQTTINNIEFKLREYQDFSWLTQFGKVFSVIDETGSGCICFGVESDKKYFYKIAGAKTIEAEVSEAESIQLLKNAVAIYQDIKHPNLIEFIECFEYEQFFIAVFAWAEGECLFDHWNFDKYKENTQIESPAKKFKKLSVEQKLNVVEVLFSFFDTVAKNGYVAVDFYDGSIMYDFMKHQVTICDIDFFRKKPTKNDLGEEYPATKRLKAPEESMLGACIDEDTNVFTLAGIIFDMFGIFTKEDIQARYRKNHFIPCKVENWTLNQQSYEVVFKATQLDRSKRYQTIETFYHDWKDAREVNKLTYNLKRR